MNQTAIGSYIARKRKEQNFTQEQLADTPHDDELEPCGSTVLCVDFAHAGIGSNSCGPELAECWKTPENVRGSIVLDPLGNV